MNADDDGIVRAQRLAKWIVLGYMVVFLIIEIGAGALEIKVFQDAAPLLISATGPVVVVCFLLNLYVWLARRRR